MKTRKRMRLEGYDYSNSGFYFVTTNIKNKCYTLSRIIDSKIVLTDYGSIVNDVWNDLPIHYSNCKLDEYVIMPDHFHGIILNSKDPLTEKQHGLSEIMRGFKSFSSKFINERIENKYKFKWHNSFYDRIIRDDRELLNVRNYILRNPIKWTEEKNNI